MHIKDHDICVLVKNDNSGRKLYNFDYFGTLNVVITFGHIENVYDERNG